MANNKELYLWLIKKIVNRGCDMVKGKLSRIIRRNPDASNKSLEEADIDAIKTKMFNYWQNTLNVNAKTCDIWFNDAFNYDLYKYVINTSLERMGPLEGKKVLDLGCGWGTLSLLLMREGADVTYIDRTPEHVQATGDRLMGHGNGVVSSATNLQTIDDNAFDFVFLNSVIEHVGNFDNDRGSAISSLDEKLLVLKEISRVLKPSGKAFLSTGNYNFPLDGEIKVWFFHWIPKEFQSEIIDDMRIKADNYGLLTWEQLNDLCLKANLTIKHVTTQNADYFKNILNMLSIILSHGSTTIPSSLVDRLKYLMENDPRYMPCWYAFLERIE